MRAMIPIDELSTIFADVTPLPQDDGPEPVCVIEYPTAFAIAYDYMRAIWKTKEFSERTLKLSATCLKLNPANYTVWHFRRQCLQSLGLDQTSICQDLDLAANLGGDNPKNYQIWYHRRALLESFPGSLQQVFLESELSYIAQVLEEDSKNYHAWSHRQWIVKTVNDEQVWVKEIEFAHELIRDDPRNNSAWNQRWFAAHRGRKEPLTLEQTRGEADFAIDTGATLDPFNESPWRYLIGLLKEHKTNLELIAAYEAKASSLRTTVLSNAKRDPDTCANLTSARVDMLEMMGDVDSLDKAIKLAEGLANEHDPIRKKYWLLRVDLMQQKISK